MSLIKIGQLATPAAIGDAVEATAEDRAAVDAKAAQVAQVVATNDGIMAAALADAGSASRGVVDSTIRQHIKTVYILWLIGQSNNAGRGTPYSSFTDPAVPYIYQFGAKLRTLRPATEPLDMNESSTSGIGPGLQFARNLIAANAVSDATVVTVPSARGGTRLTPTSGTTWNPALTSGSGALYPQAVAQLNEAKAAAATQFPNARVKVIAIWVQGESDGDANVTADAYQTVFDALRTKARTDAGDATMPFIIGGMVPEYLTTGTRAEINSVHATTPSRDPYATFVPGIAGANLGDGNHYNAVGQRAFGAAMWTYYCRLIAGLLPLTYVPGQVVLSGSPTMGSTTAALAWTAVAGAASYKLQYRVQGSGAAWSAGGTSTGTSGSVTGLTPSTNYEFRVVATSSIGDGIPSSTSTGTTAAPVTTLGILAAARYAYSLSRRVVSTYAGPLFKVRRASDNTTLDVGVNGFGLVDLTALNSFIASVDAFVDTLYDQSGNGFHLTAATTSAQPRLATAGAVVTSGGKLAATFDGADDMLTTVITTSIATVGVASMFGVLAAATPTTQKRWWGESVITASSSQYALAQPDMPGEFSKARAIAPGVPTAVSVDAYTGTIAAFNGSIHQISAIDSGTSMAQWVDATVDVASIAYTRSAFAAQNRFSIGGVARSGSYAGLAMTFSELVLFAAAVTSGDRATAQSDQKAQFGTP